MRLADDSQTKIRVAVQEIKDGKSVRQKSFSIVGTSVENFIMWLKEKLTNQSDDKLLEAAKRIIEASEGPDAANEVFRRMHELKASLVQEN